MLEVVANTSLGFAMSLALQVVLGGFYNLNTTLFVDLQITAAFTALSLVRGYVIRRFFNKNQG